MKTSQYFTVIIVSLLVGTSFLIQDYALTKNMNQASLISFTDETNLVPGTESKVKDIDHFVLLPTVKDGDKLLPLITLPEVKIEEKFNTDKLYKAVKVDGKYIPSMQLPEVKIYAH